MRELARRVVLSWPMLVAVTRVEFQKKYSGSFLGILWYPLYSALLLGVYCFVYMVVFSMRLENFGSYAFVLFVFAGLIPYLGFSDAIGTSVSSVKGNIALVKNTVFPVELIPVKHLLVSMVGLSISLGVLLVMLLPSGLAGWNLLYLPVPILLLFLFTLAVVWVVSAVAVFVPDVTHTVNVVLLLLLFVSPIAFRMEQVPENAVAIMYANPLTYLVESFRFALLGMRSTPLWLDAAFGAFSIVCVCLAGTFFRKIMPAFSDYE